MCLPLVRKAERFAPTAESLLIGHCTAGPYERNGCLWSKQRPVCRTSRVKRFQYPCHGGRTTRVVRGLSVPKPMRQAAFRHDVVAADDLSWSLLAGGAGGMRCVDLAAAYQNHQASVARTNLDRTMVAFGRCASGSKRWVAPGARAKRWNVGWGNARARHLLLASGRDTALGRRRHRVHRERSPTGENHAQ